MRAAFSELGQKKMEENPLLKKMFIRLVTLCLSMGIIFSAISYSFFCNSYMNTGNSLFMYFTIIVLSTCIGGLCGFLVFVNILVHIKRIIHELSNDEPRWDWLESEYMESDIHSAYVSIKKLHLTVSSQSKLVSLSEIAVQVAHDIRSPLVGLDLIIKDTANIPEEKRVLICNATSRIYDIANNLLAQYKNKTIGGVGVSSIGEEELIADLVLTIVAEKKYQYKNIPITFITQIDERSDFQFVDVSASTFKRVISNLLDNSVDALEHNAEAVVKITVSTHETDVAISIEDNGRGISEYILQKIMRGEITTQKVNGNGLGLSHAIKVVEDEWRGQFVINSVINEGTKIDINLKKAKAPDWFVSDLPVVDNATIIILDDDETIHQIWRKRFENRSHNINVISFYNPADLVLAYEHQKVDCTSCYLIDFELTGFNETGLDVIKKLKIVEHSYLVTSRYDDHAVRKQCKQLGVKIIPKKLAPYISITSKKKQEIADLIFIDDNESLTSGWVLHGKSVGKHVLAFNTIASLRSVILMYQKNTPIYIDSDLNDTVSGQDLAKELYDQGFDNLYLATGHHPSHFSKMPWIKDIIGKLPPF